MRRGTLAAGLILALTITSCGDEGDTFIVNTDCGLVRSDLDGTWSIQFSPATATLFGCTDPAFNNDTVTVSSSIFVFGDVEVFASAANVGFQFQNSSSPEVVLGNVEADTCTMLLSFLDNEGQYLQCIGTFDRATRTMDGACDSTTVLQTPVTDPPGILADCDLNPILAVSLEIN
jgi:hypothetical protein